MPDLLLELGTEEIPARYVRPALAQGVRWLTALFDELGVDHGELRTAATPRRLTWHVTGLAARGADRQEQLSGPPERVAFKDGEPTRAAKGFAQRAGIPVAELTLTETPKGRYLTAVKHTPGVDTAAALAERLPELIGALKFPKSMHWAGRALTFCRPIRSMMCLLGRSVVRFTVGPLTAANLTHGHPFLAPEPVRLAGASFERYLERLREVHVEADLDRRRATIRAQVEARTTRVDPALVEEVTHLVELPGLVEGAFEAATLERVPACVIVEAMTSHQRYFPVYDDAGALQPRFLTVSNRPAEHADTVRAGNERVLRARLADAAFFFEADRKRPLADRVAALEQVVFHHKLGTLQAKAGRLEALGRRLATRLGHGEAVAEQAARAGRLAKADLVTELVREFPRLQGQIGAIYAAADGEPEAVATAIEDHYRPRNPADRLPEGDVAVIASLADKLDNLVGLFAAGQQPRGSGDPFALRRQTLGLIRILADHDLDLPLEDAAQAAAAGYPEGVGAVEAVGPVVDFIRDRLRQHWLDAGQPHDLVDAVLRAGPAQVADAGHRLATLGALRSEPLWDELVEAVERTYNIHKKVEAPLPEVDPAVFTEPLETQLWAAAGAARPMLDELAAAGDWPSYARTYHDAFAKLIQQFFVDVFVNDDDLTVRHNRLALLKHTGELFRARVADLSELTDSRAPATG